MALLNAGIAYNSLTMCVVTDELPSVSVSAGFSSI